MDNELDELLESSLVDCLKVETEPPKAAAKVTIERTNLYVDEEVDDEDRPRPSTLKSGASSSNSKAKKAEKGEKIGTDADHMKLFEEIFNDEKSRESMKQFQDVLKMFNSKDGSGDDLNEKDLLDNFQNLMSELTNEDLEAGNEDDELNLEDMDFLKNLTAAAQKSAKKETTKKTDEATTEKDTKSSPLSKVLDDLTKNSEKVLKNSASGGGSGDFFSSLTGLMDDEKNSGSSEDDGLSSIMMQPILSMLFSKEILYPSLKLMLENYDKYIDDNRAKLTDKEIDKCHEQKACIAKMCHIYEESKETDSKQAKASQLKEILDQLEKCGMPPKELVPEVNPFEGMGDSFKNSACPIS